MLPTLCMKPTVESACVTTYGWMNCPHFDDMDLKHIFELSLAEQGNVSCSMQDAPSRVAPPDIPPKMCVVWFKADQQQLHRLNSTSVGT